ncbi:MAG: PEP-CTERM sorting domain-containing protein, partial [Gemmatimonadota bacterium]|nr:PEP-CTERM sorting domain-containing protein [Gemmatimonadota bacterium]
RIGWAFWEPSHVMGRRDFRCAAVCCVSAGRWFRLEKLMDVVQRLLIVAGMGAVISLTAAPVEAVITFGEAGRNTAAPTGSLANSGWQYQGQWRGFLGTPIGSQYFITAGHVGGSVGESFTYGGTSFATTAAYDDPGTDLRIWKIDGTFDSYAPLYTGVREKGKALTVFGRGTERGAEVRLGDGTLKGWQWGTADGVQSWGQNTVGGTVEGGTGVGSLLSFTFDAGGTANEGVLSGGDSGGAVFIEEKGSWKLAGINYAVDGPFSLTGVDGSGFMGAIFDQGGLYGGGDGKWTLTRENRKDLPAGAYTSRISSALPWIDSVIGSAAVSASSAPVPEPASGLLLLVGGAALLRRRRRSGTCPWTRG